LTYLILKQFVVLVEKMSLSSEEVKNLLEKALKNDSASQFQLGEYYKNEIKKPKIAFNWYIKAADSGHTDALFEVAECYIFGYGVKKDRTKAFEYCKKTAELGHKYGQFELASFYNYGIQCKCTIDKDKALEWYKKAAHNGLLEAYYNIGMIYENQKKIEKAINWYFLPAKENHINSQYKMGLCYKKLADIED
jgi:TPR repeat protein